MAVQKIQLSDEDHGAILDLHKKSQNLAANHSKIRTEFLGLEMRIVQERAKIEQTIKAFVDDRSGEDIDVVGFNIDLESGVLSVDLGEIEGEEASEASESE